MMVKRKEKLRLNFEFGTQLQFLGAVYGAVSYSVYVNYTWKFQLFLAITVYRATAKSKHEPPIRFFLLQKLSDPSFSCYFGNFGQKLLRSGGQYPPKIIQSGVSDLIESN
jgi:hypothetical protein